MLMAGPREASTPRQGEVGGRRRRRSYNREWAPTCRVEHPRCDDGKGPARGLPGLGTNAAQVWGSFGRSGVVESLNISRRSARSSRAREDSFVVGSDELATRGGGAVGAGQQRTAGSDPCCESGCHTGEVQLREESNYIGPDNQRDRAACANWHHGGPDRGIQYESDLKNSDWFEQPIPFLIFFFKLPTFPWTRHDRPTAGYSSL